MGDFGEAKAPEQWSSQQQAAYSALPNDPNDQHVKHGMAAKLFKSALQKQVNHDLTAAIADYLAALNMDDSDPAVHWYLGTAYQAAGKAAEAQREFEREKVMKTASKTKEEKPSYFLDFLNGPTVKVH